ncbi:MAG TPA: FAD-binding oxidoreductase, partial [Miltoncostaeaceae bacterium]|nr:FAD-binding oxidoreductase [Miltoncostaeaceae bacterium]
TALVEESVAAGATLVEGTIEGLRFDERGAVSGVEVDGRTLEADRVVLALGPWTAQAQRWVALPQVFGTKSVSLVLAAAAPAQAVFSEFISRTKQRYTIELYPGSGDAVYVSGFPEHGALPDDPREIVPSDAGCEELQRIAGVHARALADAPVRARSACFRPLTVDGVPLIGPVEGADGVLVATGHASWGILNAPATGRMVAEMLLDGGSRSVDATPFSPARLPAGRI